jgi:hypothetical protein
MIGAFLVHFLVHKKESKHGFIINIYNNACLCYENKQIRIKEFTTSKIVG